MCVENHKYTILDEFLLKFDCNISESLVCVGFRLEEKRFRCLENPTPCTVMYMQCENPQCEKPCPETGLSSLWGLSGLGFSNLSLRQLLHCVWSSIQRAYQKSSVLVTHQEACLMNRRSNSDFLVGLFVCMCSHPSCQKSIQTDQNIICIVSTCSALGPASFVPACDKSVTERYRWNAQTRTET